MAEQKFKEKIKHTKLCEKEKNLRKKREKQKFESIFFPKVLQTLKMKKRNWSKN